MTQVRSCDLYRSADSNDGHGEPACMHPEACLNLVEKNLTDPSILSDNERMLYEEMKKCASGLRNQLIEVLARSRGRDKGDNRENIFCKIQDQEEKNKEFVLPPDRGPEDSGCPVTDKKGETPEEKNP